ncbi:kinase-interacting family protein-like [Triticum dicoccoides]|uniref:kinase-interacting family protein-like n=1 Tax=Triticum dicoccoides TaxID=85692 RepID=UPI00188F98C2|nr:kinase-interacting family protein-like [Triticum dicoccoides]
MEKMMLQQEQEARPPASTCPPWLQAAIADIEQRVRALAAGAPDDDAAAAAADHSFAERAENYYHRRPQLLALLTDLHHRYLYLADRYAQSLLASAKSYSHHLNLNLINSDCSSDLDDRSSDAGSSLSFQPQLGIADDRFPVPIAAPAVDGELVVAELVMAWVDRDVLADEADRQRAESARKIDLQGSLLEVLESERLVLLGENARLAFRASAAEEEAAAAAAELGYTRRRAADMARLAVKLRDDHRACILGRKVEALQAQVYGLELRNRECFEAMAAWEAERKAGVAEIERLRAENRRLAAEAAAAAQASARRKRGGGKGGGTGWWWLARVRLAAEWTPCAPSSVTVRKVGEQMKGGKYNGGCFCL